MGLSDPYLGVTVWDYRSGRGLFISKKEGRQGVSAGQLSYVTLRGLWVVLGLLFVLTGTVRSGERDMHAGFALDWYEGLALGQFLEQEARPLSIVGLRRQLSQPWCAAFEVAPAGQAEHSRTVDSCEAFFQASALGLQPVQAHDIVPYRVIGTQCHAVRAVVAARESGRSYLDGFKLDQETAAMLPARLTSVALGLQSPLGADEAPVDTPAGLKPIRFVNPINDRHALIYADGATIELQILARGDFSEDGIEDLLVLVTDGPMAGGGSAMRLFVLTRKDWSSHLKLLKEFGVQARGP